MEDIDRVVEEAEQNKAAFKPYKGVDKIFKLILFITFVAA